MQWYVPVAMLSMVCTSRLAVEFTVIKLKNAIDMLVTDDDAPKLFMSQTLNKLK